MRIVLFTESFFPVVNGVSTSVRTLAERLTDRGHECVVIAPDFPDYEDPNDGLKVIRLPSWRTPLNPQNPFAYPPPFGGVEYLRREKFDIVHTHHPFGIGMHGRRLARRLGVPLISTFHTLYMEYAHYVPFLPEKPLVKAIEWHLKWYYSSCTRVIAPSRESAGRLVQVHVPEERLLVVPTGVPDAEPVERESIRSAGERYDLPKDAPVLLFVGRLAREKNLDLLLNAFNLFRKRGEFAEAAILVIAGDGPYHTDLEERVRDLGLERSVRFTGFLKREELAPLYALSSLFVFPSGSETQGVVICEAMSFGLPCIVVKGGGAPEFVRHGIDGLIVAPDPEAFAGAIESLLCNSDLLIPFRQAAQTTPLRLTPEGMIDRFVQIYEESRNKQGSR